MSASGVATWITPLRASILQSLSVAVVVYTTLLSLSPYGLAQSRIDFHLLPAVSTGPLDPEWSPDGTQLAVAMRGDIWLIPAAGGTASAITQGPGYYSEPAWSPDGSTIAFTVDRGGNLDIGVVDSAGEKTVILTQHGDDDFAPAWSGDGRELFFTSRRSGDLDILSLPVSASASAPAIATGPTIVVGGSANQYQAAVSPDGKQLAFVANVEGRIGSGGIWIKSLPDGEPRLVHYEESSYRMKPRWAADGVSLFYISDAAGSNDVARIPATGGNRVWISEDPADEFDVAPSPDGKHIAFVSNQSGPTRLFIAGTDGGPRPQWTAVKLDSRKALKQSGIIRGRVLNTQGQEIPARLMLTASDGRAYTQDGNFHRIVPATRTHYQHTNGRFEIEVPAGTTTIEAMHGFEYKPGRARIDVPVGETVEVSLQLERLDAPKERDWYSGDMHVHDLHEGRWGLTREAFFDQLRADDLGVANALIHMDGTKIMGRWSDLSGAPSPLSTGDTLLQYSQEYRGYFGHFAMLGLKRFQLPLIGGVASTPYAPDILGLQHIDNARAEGAITGFVHPFNQPVDTPAEVGRRDLPVLAALGKGDFYDVVSVASRELESAAVYHRLLNAGVRLAATGGTDNFSDVWFDPSGGAARTYARIEPAGASVSLENWLAAVKAGRSFASNGPLLFLSVNGKQPGTDLLLGDDASSALSVKLEVSSIAPLDRIELIVNGEVAHSWDPDKVLEQWKFTTNIALSGPGWISARATGPASRYVGDAFAFAETSPVHIKRNGRSFSSAADAAFLAASVAETWKLAQARNAWISAAQKNRYAQGIQGALDYYHTVILQHPEDALFTQPAPEQFTVHLETSQGPIVIELFREWSPLGVDRFYHLVRFGYYDDMRLHRIRAGEFVQFGIHGNPALSQLWRDQEIKDDPVVASNLRGTIAFAHGEPLDDRSTQVYINLRDKPEMDATGFSVMGRVIEGMEVADRLYADYGERAGGGIRGGKQAPVFNGGNDYLDRNFPKLDRIARARIVTQSAVPYKKTHKTAQQ